jgi:hypothetical protein
LGQSKAFKKYHEGHFMQVLHWMMMLP